MGYLPGTQSRRCDTKGQSRPVSCALVSSSLVGGCGDLLMRLLVSALNVYTLCFHRFSPALLRCAFSQLLVIKGSPLDIY